MGGDPHAKLSVWQRLRAFLLKETPPSILGQRNGWGGWVRMDEREISAAHKLAEARHPPGQAEMASTSSAETWRLSLQHEELPLV